MRVFKANDSRLTSKHANFRFRLNVGIQPTKRPAFELIPKRSSPSEISLAATRASFSTGNQLWFVQLIIYSKLKNLTIFVFSRPTAFDVILNSSNWFTELAKSGRQSSLHALVAHNLRMILILTGV